jgi:hypothetical protein
MGEIRGTLGGNYNAYKIVVKKRQEKRYLEKPRRDDEVASNFIFKNKTRLKLLRLGSNGSWEHGNKPFDSLKFLEFLSQLSDCQIFKEGTDLYSYIKKEEM